MESDSAYTIGTTPVTADLPWRSVFVLFSSVSVLFGCHVGHMDGSEVFGVPSPIFTPTKRPRPRQIGSLIVYIFHYRARLQRGVITSEG